MNGDPLTDTVTAQQYRPESVVLMGEKDSMELVVLFVWLNDGMNFAIRWLLEIFSAFKDHSTLTDTPDIGNGMFNVISHVSNCSVA